MSIYKVYENQTLLDVSAHVYGHVDAVMELALLNNISITDNLTSGQIIKLVAATKNTLVKKALESRNIVPATGLATEPTEQQLEIDYRFPQGEFPISF